MLTTGANPAVLASVASFTAGAYASRRFLLQDLDYGLLAAAFPAWNGVAGIHLSRQGAGAHWQYEAGAAYGKRLGDASIGVRFSYFSLAAEGYGRRGTLIADVGTTWQVSTRLRAGLALSHPAGARLTRNGVQVASACKAGAGYAIADHLLFSVECLRHEGKPVTVRCAFQYQPVQQLMLQSGISTASAQPFTAVCMQWREWRIYVNVTWHARLGISPALAVLYHPFKQKQSL